MLQSDPLRRCLGTQNPLQNHDCGRDWSIRATKTNQHVVCLFETSQPQVCSWSITPQFFVLKALNIHLPGRHLGIELMRCLDFTQLLSHQWKHPWNFTDRNLPRRRTFPTTKRPCNIGLSCKQIVSWNHQFGEGLLWYPKDHWALEWKGLNLYSWGLGPQNGQFWGVRIPRVVPLGSLLLEPSLNIHYIMTQTHW